MEHLEHAFSVTDQPYLLAANPQPLRPDAPLTDAAIREIARQITQAVRRPRPDDCSKWILAATQELSRDDEDRVIAALSTLDRGSVPIA